MKSKEGKIAGDNVTALMNGKFNFYPKKILNKTLIFDTKKVDENIIMDRTIEALPSTNDEFYIEHPVGLNSFTLKREDGRLKKVATKGKKHILKLKNGPEQRFIF